MCGIFGWVLPADRAEDPRLLEELTGLLAHRGPDGSGHWIGMTTDRGSLIFASEVNPLLRFPGLDQGFDWEELGNYLLYRYVPGPTTFFRGVRKLLPGCRAIWTNGELSIDQYFAPPLRERSPDIR